MGDNEFVDKDDKQLLKVLMTFMDGFFQNYTVLENIKTKNVDTIPRYGYRPTSKVIYSDEKLVVKN